MRVLIRIIAFFIIIFLGIYFFFPQIFQPKIYDLDKIDIKKYVITPNPKKIYYINLKISSTNVYNIGSLDGGIRLYFDAVYIFKVNIIDLLENSVNKKLTLRTHIKQLEAMQIKLENAISILENNVSDENIKYEEYMSEKKQGDQDFIGGFTQKDVALSINGFNTSYKNGPLATKHRILKNASLYLLNKLKRIKTLIDAKFNILSNNKDTITDNFYIIKGDLLNKLRKLKYQLENNDYLEE